MIQTYIKAKGHETDGEIVLLNRVKNSNIDEHLNYFVTADGCCSYRGGKMSNQRNSEQLPHS